MKISKLYVGDLYQYIKPVLNNRDKVLTSIYIKKLVVYKVSSNKYFDIVDGNVFKTNMVKNKLGEYFLDDSSLLSYSLYSKNNKEFDNQLQDNELIKKIGRNSIVDIK